MVLPRSSVLLELPEQRDKFILIKYKIAIKT